MTRPRWASIQAALLLVADDDARGPGVPVAELSRLLGLPPRGVTRWVERLAGAGNPTGDPGDLLDVEVEDGRVRVHMGPWLRGPLRLTTPEVVALLVVLRQAPTEGADDALAARVSALRQRLLALAAEGAGTVAEDLGERIAVDAGGEAPAHLAALRAAVEGHRGVELAYYSASTDQVRRWPIKPCALVQHGGTWYVVTDRGWPLRLSRIRHLAETGETFEPPADLDLGRWRQDVMFHGEALEPVVLQTPRGRREMSTASRTQLAAWVRRHRGAVRVVEPDDLRQSIAEEARALLERYP